MAKINVVVLRQDMPLVSILKPFVFHRYGWEHLIEGVQRFDEHQKDARFSLVTFYVQVEHIKSLTRLIRFLQDRVNRYSTVDAFPYHAIQAAANVSLQDELQSFSNSLKKNANHP